MAVVLLNVAHVHRNPRRIEGAALRVLGKFNDIKALKQHADRFYASSDVDLVAAPLGEWIPILQTRPEDAQCELSHVAKCKDAYKKRLQDHADEFRENIEQRRCGEVTCEDQTREVAISQETPYHSDEPSTVPRNAEIRMQNVVVFSIIPDYEQRDHTLQEPCIAIWEVLETEEQAKQYIKDDLTIKAKDYNLDIAVCYEFFPLTNIDLSKIKEEFRDENLTAIIDTHKAEARQVREYKRLCQEKGQDINYIDFTKPTAERQGDAVREVIELDSRTD